MLPHDLRARHIETVGRMAGSELAELALTLPPNAADRLAALIAGLVEAAAELRAELAYSSTDDRVIHRRDPPVTTSCEVIDLRTRRRAS